MCCYANFDLLVLKKHKFKMQWRLSTALFPPLVILLFSVRFSQPIAVRGNYPWTMILCKYADRHWEPKDVKWYKEWLISDQPGAVSNFFRTASNGLYTIHGSNVLGWFRLPFTKATVQHMAISDRKLANETLMGVSDDEVKLYYKVKEVCINHARQHRKKSEVIHENVIVVINDGSAAVFCRDQGVLITPKFHLTSALVHEMAHSFSIGHSYSDQQTKLFPHSSPGEYDDRYDLMSTANAYMSPSKFGLTGPNFAGPHLDFLGWLPRYRTFYFGSDGVNRQIVRLSSLSLPYAETKDYLLVHVPYDRDDRQLTFTVEFRTQAGNDLGTRGGVVVHQIRKRDGHYFSHAIKHGDIFYELRAGSERTFFLQKMSDNRGRQFIQIRVNSIDWDASVAEVTISSTFDPNTCLFGEKKRNLYEGDELCVDSLQAGAISGLLEAQESRKSGSPCLPGFSGWQLATETFCLDGAELAKLEQQQQAANGRLKFFERSDTFGMNECIDGLYWRMIDEFDYVCVSKSVHEQMIQQRFETAALPPCAADTTSRLAFQTDRECVPPAERDAVRQQNVRRPFTQKYYAFFNGVDALFHQNGN